MTPEQIEKGLTAFVDGQSNWSSCFFARALGPGFQVAVQCDGHDPITVIAQTLSISRAAVQAIINAFDSRSPWVTKDNLRRLAAEAHEERVRYEVIDELLADLPKGTMERTPRMEVVCA